MRVTESNQEKLDERFRSLAVMDHQYLCGRPKASTAPKKEINLTYVRLIPFIESKFKK